MRNPSSDTLLGGMIQPVVFQGVQGQMYNEVTLHLSPSTKGNYTTYVSQQLYLFHLIDFLVFNLAEEAISGFSQHTLQSFTVERLRGLLRQSGLSTKGKKARPNHLNLLRAVILRVCTSLVNRLIFFSIHRF
jgi:hypothetical protein